MSKEKKLTDKQKKIKILVVEDDPHVTKQYDLGLPNQIFHKEFAKDGEEAISMYESMKPDIILLDIMLPKENGFVILKKIRHEFKDKSTSIIMATALSGKDDITECVKLGISGYIVKPINPKEVASKVLSSFKKGKQGKSN